MPLGEKISNLVELEAIALGETLSYVFNSPYQAVGKVVDFMSEFGLNMDKSDEEARRPEEHKKDETKDKGTGTKKKTTRRKTTSRKKTATKRSAKKSGTKSEDSDADDKKEDK